MFGAVLAAVLLGFLAGLWSFKVKSRWCPTCGGVTYKQPTSVEPRRGQP